MNIHDIKKHLLDFLHEQHSETCKWNKIPQNIPSEIRNNLIKMIQQGMIPVDIQCYEPFVPPHIVEKCDPIMLEHFKQFDYCWKHYYFPYLGFYIKKNLLQDFQSFMKQSLIKDFYINKRENYYYITTEGHNSGYMYQRILRDGTFLNNIHRSIHFAKYINKKIYAFYLAGNANGFLEEANPKIIRFGEIQTPSSLKTLNEEYEYIEIFQTTRNNDLFLAILEAYKKTVQNYRPPETKSIFGSFFDLFSLDFEY